MDNLMQSRSFTSTSNPGAKIMYRIFIPENYNPDKKYPLVTFLHGVGERGTDNKVQLNVGFIKRLLLPENQKKYECILIAPQCPVAGEDGKEGRWMYVDWSQGTFDRDTVPESRYLKAVIELTDELQKEFSIDKNRLYITGLSMGGYGTWDAITRYPGKFRAAVPICGGGDPAKAAPIKDMKIWAFHGELDDVVPAKGSQNMIKALREAGGNPRYTEYKGVDHGSWERAYAEPELLDWLFDNNQK